jgi:hypothetical protein
MKGGGWGVEGGEWGQKHAIYAHKNVNVPTSLLSFILNVCSF